MAFPTFWSPILGDQVLTPAVLATVTGTAARITTALNTVGAAVIPGAAIAGGYIQRGGAQIAAFTDTTDTATAILAAQPNAHIGQTWSITYANNTGFPATIAAGTGVTLTGNTVVTPNGFVEFLASYTAAGAVSLHQVSASNAIPPAQFTTAALSVGTLAAGQITGAGMTVLQNTGATPGAQTVRTAAQMLADFPGAYVGMSYMLRIVNTGAGTLTLTADGGATVTISGTATIATNTFRDYVVAFTGAATATITSVGSGTSP